MEFINYMMDVFSSDYVIDEGRQLSKKPIERSEKYNIAYMDWLLTNRYQVILKAVYQAHAQLAKRDPHITFLKIPTIYGFTLHAAEGRWSGNDLRFMFEYYAQVLEEVFNYEPEIALVEETQYKDRHEVVERCRLGTLEDGGDYRNILLHLCSTGGKITSLKFSAVKTERRIVTFEYLLRNLIEV